MSLIEVVTALLVFAIISTGIAAGMITMNRITADTRSRTIATNLAEQDLDSVRAIADPFAVYPQVTTQVVSGRTYTVTRTTSWITSAGVDATCGTSVNYYYRRITAKVTWTGQLSTTAPVRSDTVIAPLSRITDAASGAVSIKVIGADGLARSGVAVTITPVTGGAPLTAQPAPTDVEGCAYATQLVPGTYKIVLAKSGYIDTNQATSPTTTTAVVTAGQTYAWSVQYDAWGTFNTTYASDFTAGTVTLPNTLETTYAPNTTAFPLSTVSPATTSVRLHPFPSGYTAVAGTFATPDRSTTCASVDPAAWVAGSVNGFRMAQGVRAAATATAGQTATFGTAQAATIPMGIVKVTGLSFSTLKATSVTSPADLSNTGYPGCATATTTYTFGTTPIGLSGTVYLALPYGSWTISSTLLGNGFAYAVPRAQLSMPTNRDGDIFTTSGSAVVVMLDPRRLAP